MIHCLVEQRDASTTLGAARVFPRNPFFLHGRPVISASAIFGICRPPFRQKLAYRPRQGGWKCFYADRPFAWLPNGLMFGMNPRTKDHDREKAAVMTRQFGTTCADASFWA
jgi:hypothetical protein